MKRFLLLAVVCAAAASFGLPSIANATDSFDVVLVDRLNEEDVIYSTPEPEVVASLAGKLELLAFTYRSEGTCGACDLVRPALNELCEEYPITRVYYDSRKGANAALEYGVRALPTFVMVRRDKNGKAHEIERFSGGYSPQTFIAKVEGMFRRAGYDRDAEKPTGVRPIPKRDRLRAPSGRWVWLWY